MLNDGIQRGMMSKLTYLALLLVLVLHKVFALSIVDRGRHRRDLDRHQRDVDHRDDDCGTRTVSSPDDATIPRSVRTVSNESTLTNGHEEILEYHYEGIKLIGWHFDYVRLPLIISIFLIVTALCKLGKCNDCSPRPLRYVISENSVNFSYSFERAFINGMHSMVNTYYTSRFIKI